MSYFRITGLSKNFYPIIILSLLIFSCTIENSIVGASNQSVGKTTSVSDNGDGIEPETWLENQVNNQTLLGYIFMILSELLGDSELKEYSKMDANLGCIVDWINSVNNSPNCKINSRSGYDFRDNYLSDSEKGEIYILSYYFLSHYSIENNLVMKYPMEHLSIMNMGIDVSRELQYGTNDNQILITRSTYSDLKDIVNIYRDSENHEDIDIILDFLETDLENYFNKTKAEISVDFEQN